MRFVVKWSFRLVSVALLLFAGLFGALRSIENPEHATECVALIHGLGRSPASFSLTAAYLRREGYYVFVPGYPSTKLSPEVLAPYIEGKITDVCTGFERTHIVTHSMGGIMVRMMFAETTLPNFGHVVMLAPPNHGSEIVDVFGGYRWFAWLNGPAGIALGTSTTALPARLPPVSYSTGIIAGTRSYNPFYSALVEGTDDGKVSIDSTTLDGMADHIEVATSHTFIMNHPVVLVQAANFIRSGEFATPPIRYGDAVRRVIGTLLVGA